MDTLTLEERVLRAKRDLAFIIEHRSRSTGLERGPSDRDGWVASKDEHRS